MALKCAPTGKCLLDYYSVSLTKCSTNNYDKLIKLLTDYEHDYGTYDDGENQYFLNDFIDKDTRGHLFLGCEIKMAKIIQNILKVYNCNMSIRHGFTCYEIMIEGEVYNFFFLNGLLRYFGKPNIIKIEFDMG